MGETDLFRQELRHQVARHLAKLHDYPQHRAEIAAKRLGHPSSRASSRPVAWHDQAEDGSGFWRCRQCPPGFCDYHAEVENPEPSQRLHQLIAGHYGEAHPDEDYAPRRLSTKHHAAAHDVKLATFIPATPLTGAGITCRLCPQGLQRIFLTQPAYHDARQLHAYHHAHPELEPFLATRPTEEQAELLEAASRGMLGSLDPDAIHKALDAARRGALPEPKLDPFAALLLQLMLARVAAGENITDIIPNLDHLSRKGPVVLACQLAEHIPTINPLLDTDATPDAIAQQVADHLHLPHTALHAQRSRLWEIWQTND